MRDAQRIFVGFGQERATMNEAQLAKEFLKKAVAQACGPALAMVPDGARRMRL
jgi:hypothetical protein